MRYFFGNPGNDILKASNSHSDRPPEFQAMNKDFTPGLRERQKIARYERILASARSLFNTLGFDNTTMAAIAEQTEVSTPTIFNYFKTKDQLMLALVLQVHHETQEWVHAFKPTVSSNLAEAICEFLSMYTRSSLKTINRQTWRHVESTSIRLPESDFVKQYEALSVEMFNDFYDFLVQLINDRKLTENAWLKPVAKIIFNHWGVLFIELVRDESLTLEKHIDQLHVDLTALIGMMKIR